MQPIKVPGAVVGVTTQGCRRAGNSFTWAGARRSSRRHYATPKSKRTPPPPPSPNRQRGPATPKPLPFKPATPKPAPVPKSKSSSQEASSSREEFGRDRRRPVSELVRTRWFPLFGAGAAAMCVGLFTVSLATYWRSRPAERWPAGREPETPTGRPSVQSPREFDQHLDKSEWRYGITALRRRVAADMARGHVLEVAVGTGRNFDYYDWTRVTDGLAPAPAEEKRRGWLGLLGGGDGKEKEEGDAKGERGKAEEKKLPSPQPRTPQDKKPHPNALLSFTGLDIAPSVLDLALTRIRQVVPHMDSQVPKKPTYAQLATSTTGSEGVTLANGRIRLLRADAQTSLPAPPSTTTPAPEYYDTIIQTFGLCSVRDPVALLRAMASRVRPGTGRIVLLEHGRTGEAGWVGRFVDGLLDRGAREHFARFGCWWNRDVELVVAAARRDVPGLEVLRLERPGWATLGTHVLVELRVREDAAASSPGSGAEDGVAGREEEAASAVWWPSFLSVSNKSKTKKD
ncbi:hypothetical protein GGR52DRAFT_543124 [Hypoxylon sp. FL1284]|nr:hypothetical protein GGR52DRAFT_543124 [Hypoxylon sp. FL1284]